MLDTATTDATPTARERRRAETTAEILDAAWALCRDGGLASLSLRELAAAVGMRAPSLYSYFDSKLAIYDAMFAQGYDELEARTGPTFDQHPVTRQLIKDGAREWVEFCVGDPVRYELLFQRTIPGFEPSEASYAKAVAYLGRVEQHFADAGIDDPAAVDLFTAIVSGLVAQQLANEPGGDRWTRLLDETVDMFLDRVDALPATVSSPEQRTSNARKKKKGART